MRPILMILLVGLAMPAFAHLVDVSYWPEDPEVGDELWVQVNGWLSDSCWEMTATSQEVVGQEIRIFVDLYDSWEPETACLLVITEFVLDFQFPDLAAGDYTLVVTERHDSIRTPEDQVITLPVVVTGPVATEPASWTTLRSLYR